MKLTQKRRAQLALFEGWVDPRAPEEGEFGWVDGIHPEMWAVHGDHSPRWDLPNYFEDLNAVARLEEKIVHRGPYRQILSRICQKRKPETGYGERVCHANAAERCEAILEWLAQNPQ